MKKAAATTFKAFLVELFIYAFLVVGYFFLVLRLLGDWLHELAGHHRYTYAVTAILLISAQAVLLEMLTTFLLRMIRRRTE